MNHEATDIGGEPAQEFARLAARHQRQLFLYIFSLVPNVTDAEEILQTTNLVAWTKFAEFDPTTNFFAWAGRVAYYEVLKYRTRRGRDAVMFGEEFLEQVNSAATAQADGYDRRREALDECLKKLRDFDRRLILLRYSDGSTTQSVADEFQRSAKSIYASLSRIRDTLLACINRRLALEERG
jgi:RNA polymerase sigma-70 factor (ECF subfamily)